MDGICHDWGSDTFIIPNLVYTPSQIEKLLRSNISQVKQLFDKEITLTRSRYLRINLLFATQECIRKLFKIERFDWAGYSFPFHPADHPLFCLAVCATDPKYLDAARILEMHQTSLGPKEDLANCTVARPINIPKLELIHPNTPQTLRFGGLQKFRSPL